MLGLGPTASLSRTPATTRVLARVTDSHLSAASKPGSVWRSDQDSPTPAPGRPNRSAIAEGATMSTTTSPVGLTAHGLAPAGSSSGTRPRRSSTRTRSGAGTARWRRAARSSSTPASTPAARRRTSSSSREPGSRGPDLVGRRQPAARRGALRRAARRRSSRTSSEQDLYVVDAFAGADPAHRIARPRRHRAARTTRSSRRRCSSSRPRTSSTTFEPRGARPARARRSRPTRPTDGTRTGTFVVLHPARTEVLIGGTFYAGEIKKSIFTVMNDRLPLEGVFPMHCSANVGRRRPTSRSSSASPAPARRRSPPTRSAR